MKFLEYIEAIKAKHGVTSDYAVAKLLKTTPQMVSDWMSGRRLPGPLMCFRIAELLGDQPTAVQADIELERAEKAGKDEDANAWREISGKITKGLLVTVMVMGSLLGGFNADAGSGGAAAQNFDSISVYIVSNK